MQENDARIFRGAALPSVACGALAMAVSALAAGLSGLMGSALAVLIVLGCFGLGQWAVIAVTRRNKDLFLAANLLGFVVKMAVLGVILVTLGRSAFVADLSDTAFVYSALAVVLVWLGGQTWATSRAKILHVDPAEESGAK
ncbi:hypothetical protein [Nocardiopsis sp. ATB16-24]|uniref:hypothetical protein n=1 Tax=Nocardiopsis sp. ATB16-24 TaxID=3019555 RepID=UPI0025540934|nr:hypothetical protein [Nocardiopsis sp. ATB16-24]